MVSFRHNVWYYDDSNYGGGGFLSRQRRADLWLVLVTAFWGGSYYLMDLCLNDLQPLNLNAFRFLVAFVVLGIIFFSRLRRLNRKTLKYSVLVGACLVLVYIGATYGVLYTSISNAGFICALSVITTPLFAFVFQRKRPDRRLAIALILCTLGLALLTLNEQLHFAKGDVICLVCAVFYGLDLLITEKGVADEQVDALNLGICQLGVVGIIMLVLSLLFEQPHLPQSPVVWGSALFLGLFCSGAAFVIQAVQQQYTTASHVGLIFTLEPVFSAIVAFTLAGERLLPRGYVGAVLMLLSLVIMELDFPKLLQSKKGGANNV